MRRCLPIVWLLSLACASVAAGEVSIADGYFAPASQLMFKMVLPGGVIREFERDYSNPGTLIGADGWAGRMVGQGRVEVYSPAGGERFVFDRGRLVRHVQGNADRTFPYAAQRCPPAGIAAPLTSMMEPPSPDVVEGVEREWDSKWAGTGRLAFPYANPNLSGMLYAELVILALGFALWSRGLVWKSACGILASAAFCCLLFTGSRGCLLAVACTVPCWLLGRIRRMLGSRAFWLCVGTGALLFVAWFCFFGQEQLMRGFDSSGGIGWSNAVRLETWAAAPRMMASAPGGWGFVGTGRAYLDWFQPLHVFCLTGSLMNDHLTLLASCGNGLRMLWLTTFFSVFGICCVVAFRRRESMALAIWLAFSVAAWFNPVFFEPGLWILPVVCLIVAVARFPWRERRVVVVTVLGALVLSGSVLSGLLFFGERDRAYRRPVVTADGHRVLVNGKSPRIWVVDSGDEALGGLLAAKDIRGFYSDGAPIPSLGFVRSISDLPSIGVDTLVLGGRSGHEWLELLSRDPGMRKRLPRRVVFISPPFSPSAIPPGLHGACAVKVVVGEFAARFDPDYQVKCPWIEIVPGMECYILRWLEHVLEG